jgi:catechol O-methyltransferase
MTNRLQYLWSCVKAARRQGETDDRNKEALVARVVAKAPKGDVDAVIREIDDFGRNTTFLMNIGDEKGRLLDDSIRRAQPERLLELGAFCGYSGLRMARVMPEGAQLYSVEMNPRNADIATRVWEHAGVAERVKAIVGTIDDGVTIDRLMAECGPAGLDFAFIDHDHSHYLSDLLLLMNSGLARTGTVVLADNVKVPGAPKYLAYMRQQEGIDWWTVEHKTHLEYQPLIPDLVLESTYLAPGGDDEGS